MNDPIQSLAVSKYKNGKRDEVNPGQYDVDFFVHVFGTVKVGEDYEQRVAQAANPWKLLAVALSKLNQATVASIVEASERIDDKMAKELQKRAVDALTAIKGKVQQPCRGKVTAKLQFEEVSSEI